MQRSIVIDLVPRDGTIKSEHRLGWKLAEGCRGQTKERADPRSVGRLGVSLFRTTDLSARTLSAPLATGEREGTRWSNVAGVDQRNFRLRSLAHEDFVNMDASSRKETMEYVTITLRVAS